MAKRPKLLNTTYLKKRFQEEGRSGGDIAAYVSEMQLVVPILLRNLSKQQLLDAIGKYADEFGLAGQYQFAEVAMDRLKQWSTEELTCYAKERQQEIS